jgi:hypothetical protein
MKATTIGSFLTALILVAAVGVQVQALAQRPGSSPLSPAPPGETLKGIVECGQGYTSHELFDEKMTLMEVVRGEEAWKRIQKASSSNKPPDAGFEYVLARVKFEYYARGTPGLCVHEMKPEQFSAFSADGSEYQSPPIVPPKPEMRGSLHSGDVLEGWVAFLIPQQDKKPLMNYSADKGGAIVHGGEKWFQLYQ